MSAASGSEVCNPSSVCCTFGLSRTSCAIPIIISRGLPLWGEWTVNPLYISPWGYTLDSMKTQSVVLDVDDRGRISVGKFLEGVERVVVTTDGTGRLVIEPAVVVRAIVPRIRHNAALSAEIDASLNPDQTFLARKPRPRQG